MLTEAFEAGQVSLLVQPSPELLQLPDPYDRVQNAPYGLHDASLFNGKYYLYFGPVPALVLFWPMDALFHVKVWQDTAIAVFCISAFIASLFLLNVVLDRIHPPVPLWIWAVGAIALGLCNTANFLLIAPGVYGVAIACGLFFSVCEVYFLVSALCSTILPKTRLIMGSLCLGLAVGARPSCVILLIALPLVLWGLIQRHQKKYPRWDFFLSGACLFVPCGLCMLGLFAYNYVRFGSIFEFGLHYQLASDIRQAPIFRPDLVLSRLGNYLFHGYAVDGSFPFIHLPLGAVMGEPEVGTFAMNPLVCSIPVWLLYAVSNWKEVRQRYSWIFLSLVLGAGLALLIILSTLTTTSVLRYHFDYETFILIAALFTWADLYQFSSRNSKLRRVVGISGVLFIAYGCCVGLCFGYNDISPAAVRRFYAGNGFAEQSQIPEAIEKYREAIAIAPDFSLAEVNLALVLAAQGKGHEAAEHFSHAVRTVTAINASYQDKAYMPAFVGHAVYDPLGNYFKLAGVLLSQHQTDEALMALDGLVRAYSSQRFYADGLNALEAVAKAAKTAQQIEFAAKVEDRLEQYRADLSRIKG